LSSKILQCDSYFQYFSGKRQKAEAPTFLKKLGDCVVYQGMTARFTACVTGCPEPELEWYRDTTRLFNSERVKFEKETSGLVRLIIEKVNCL
jgi:Immunoglobulin I-set domain